MIRDLMLIMAVLVLTRVAGAGHSPALSTEAIDALIDAAQPGTTVVLPAGTYEGSLVINKPVVVDGRGETTIDGLGEGTVVEIRAAGVTVRDLHVRGSGTRVETEPAGIRSMAPETVIEGCRVEDALFGIDLKGAADSTVRGNCVVGKDLDPGRRGDGIRLWWSHGCLIEANTVSNSRDMVFWYSEDLVIRDNRVDTSRYGLHFMYSHNTTLSGNVLRANSVGIYLMYSNNITLEHNTLVNNRGASGYGLGLKDCDGIVVRSNAMLANRVGAYIDNSPSSVDSTGLIEDNLVAFNEVGILLTPNTHDNVITGNGFVENEEQAGVHGRGDLSLNQFASDGRGNFWSDYAGFDQDNDGVGDLEYEAASLFESLLAREPNLRLFVHSPAQQAVEFTARALPEVRPEPKFVDAAPLMSPPEVRVAGVRRASPRAMGAVAALLLVGGLGALALLGRPNGLPARGCTAREATS